MIQIEQLIDEAVRSRLGSIKGEQLDNLIALINDKIGYPLEVTLDGDVLTVGPSTYQSLESNSLHGTKNSYKWRIPLISGLDVVTVESTLNLKTGVTTGSFKNPVDPGVALTPGYYIQMGVEIRSDGFLYIVWGAEGATPGATLPPNFLDSDAFPTVTLKLHDDGTGGAWNFVTSNKTDVEIIKGAGGGGGSLKTYPTVAVAKAEQNGRDNKVCYIVENETFYRYESTSLSTIVGNDKFIIDVTIDPNARWMGLAGKYPYRPSGLTFETVAEMKALTTGLDNIVAYCVETESYYKYEATALTAITGDDKAIIEVTIDTDARWMATAGKYQYKPTGLTFATVAEMKALVTGVDNILAYCIETGTYYRYEATSFTAIVGDDKFVIEVTSDTDARWIGTAGKYPYFVSGLTFALVADMKAVITGLDNVLAYCVETETYYRYEATSFTALPNNDTSIIEVTSDANARWVGVAGQYSYFGSGDLTDLLARMELFLNGSEFREGSMIVFSSDKNDKTDGPNSTGTFVGDSYQMTTGQILRTIALLDPDTFLEDEQDITSVATTVYYKRGFEDTAPVIQVSRNGGLDWQNTISEREPGTDLYQGTLDFVEEANITIEEYADGTGTPLLTEIDTTTVQKISRKVVTTEQNVFKELELYVSKTGSPIGYLTLTFVRDNAGAPSTNGEDIVTSTLVDIANLSAGLNTITVTIPNTVRKAGTYWIVIETEDVYKSVFATGVTSISLRGDSLVNGNTLSYNGTVWASIVNMDAYFVTRGRVQDLRMRVTASMNSNLTAVGVYYGNDYKLVAEPIDVEDFQFSGDLNKTVFTLSFLPNPTMLRMADGYEGKVYHGRTLSYDGYDVVLPTGFFDRPGVACRALFWHEGAAYDTTDENAQNILMLQNKVSKITDYVVGSTPECNSPDLWSAFSLAADGAVILVTENQATAINRQLTGKKVKIIFKPGVKVICSTALASAIVTFGDDIVTENFAVESTITAGTTVCGIELDSDRSYHSNLSLTQNGVGGTITDGIKINLNKGGNFASALVRQQTGTITNELMDNSLVLTNDVTVRGLTA